MNHGEYESAVSQGKGPAASGPGGDAAAALPCLNTINCNERGGNPSKKPSSGHRKTAFALKLNVLRMIEKHGLERIGFLTLTFARHVVAYKAAQKALHSLMTGVIKPRYAEYIIVMERMDSKRIHYHLLVVLAQDIRTGFDFTAVKHGDYRSANEYLRKEWKFWRDTAPKYGFGRTELMPIKKTAAGVAKYIGKYVAKHIGQRLPEDKGARLVRYSKGANRVGTRFSWVSPGAVLWRSKLGAICRMLRLNPENYNEMLQEWFGRNWICYLGPVIESVKLPKLNPEEESWASMRSAWVVIVNERERRCRRKRHELGALDKRLLTADGDCVSPKMASKGTSWLQNTIKDD